MFTRTLALCLVPFILLSACGAADGEFPSLERRPYESNSPIAAPEIAVAAPVTLPTALAANVDDLGRRHVAAQAIFAKDLQSVQSVASRAAGSSPGSESWVNAHLLLSRLDKARGDSVAVVREFDTLISAQADADSDFVQLLTEAQKPVADDVAAQNAEIERLSRLIGE
jgi:ABC-type transporter Mla subunit MlaD